MKWRISLQAVERTLGRGTGLGGILSYFFGRVSGLGRECREASSQRLYRVSEARGIKDAWEIRVIELIDGKPMGEIIETLYREEIKAGAWLVDVGLWKDIFDQSVVKTINQLAGRGLVRLQTEDSV